MSSRYNSSVSDGDDGYAAENVNQSAVTVDRNVAVPDDSHTDALRGDDLSADVNAVNVFPSSGANRQPVYVPLYEPEGLRYVFLATNGTRPPLGISEIDNAIYDILWQPFEIANINGISKRDIHLLKSYVYDEDNELNDQTVCCVCLKDFRSYQVIRVLLCEHEFHAPCVDRWLEGHITCPLCRQRAA